MKQISLVEGVARNILKKCPLTCPLFPQGVFRTLPQRDPLSDWTAHRTFSQEIKRYASLYAYTKVEGFCKRLSGSLDESVLFNYIFLVISFVSFKFRAASRLLLFRDAWSVYSQGGLLRLWKRSQETILHVGRGLDSTWIFTRCETLKQCMEMKSCDSDKTEMEMGCSRLCQLLEKRSRMGIIQSSMFHNLFSRYANSM